MKSHNLRIHRLLKLAPLALILPWLAGCAAGGDVSKPIPSAFYPAPQKARLTVVMLPGIDDGLKALENRHVAALIQKNWPHADVVLTGLTLPFYKQGRAAQRLHDEVIARYRKKGQPVWLAGISLGGLGVLLYGRQYPGDTAGMLLMSPYLGGDAIRKKIQAAGGLAQWNPGPRQHINADNFRHELWRYLKSWRNRPQRTRTVWLAYGTNDRFRKSIALLTPMLPPGHVIELPGSHNWNLWNRAFTALLKRVAHSQTH
ncbi:MAG: alpha/beta hydrolase-fold protein [Gammaproteobacteria bacterium]